MRVGVVPPRSTRYPELASEFLGGFETFAATAEQASHGRSIEVVRLDCDGGVRAPLGVAVQAAGCGSVDVVAGFAAGELAARMAPALEARGVPFVASDLGADVVRMRRDSPYLVRHSLGYWQANHAMGTWAAAHLGQRALIAVDFLEAGYDMVYAFRRAFEAAGGEVVQVKTTGLPDGTGSFADVAGAIRSHAPDFVYAFYSGKRARAFLQFYEAQGLARTVPLAGAALLTDHPASSGARAGFDGVLTVASWSHEHASAENAAFTSAYREARGSEASLFAVLGYETAQRIAAGTATLRGDTADARAFARAMASASYAGPRGAVMADPDTTESAAGAYVRRLSRTEHGLADVTVDRLAPLKLARATAHELRTMVKSGWAHAYLAA